MDAGDIDDPEATTRANHPRNPTHVVLGRPPFHGSDEEMLAWAEGMVAAVLGPDRHRRVGDDYEIEDVARPLLVRFAGDDLQRVRDETRSDDRAREEDIDDSRDD